MKKKLLTYPLILLLGLFTVISCEEDKPATEEEGDKDPVQFSITQEPAGANQVIVSNETENASCLWEWFAEGSDVALGSSNADIDTIDFAFKGSYSIKFTVNLADGSETRDSLIVVSNSDVTQFGDPIWDMLANGVDNTKSWVLDVYGQVHPGPLTFLGTDWDFAIAGNDDSADDAWQWDAGTDFTFEMFEADDWTQFKNLRMWLPAEDGSNGYGTMTFGLDGGYNFTADKLKEDAEAGTFVLDTEEMMLTLNGATILRSYKPFAQVNVDPTCEGDDCEKAADPVDGMAGISNWSDYGIFAITDTVLRLAVVRDQDIQQEGPCYLVYNFISKEYADANPYTPPSPGETEIFTAEETTNTAFQKADLEGTWKYAPVIQGWIAFQKTGDQGTIMPARLFELWETRDEVITTLDSWGATDVATTFTAADDDEFIFNSDGSCTLNGVANTYTVADGVITFGTALTTEISLVWITMEGTELKVIDFDKKGPEDGLVDHGFTGTWFGYQNGTKDEYQAVQLVKQ